MGRTARKLAALLEALGYTEARLYPARGAYRTDERLDAHRWDGSAIHRGVRRPLQSFDTMTRCVEKGIEIDADGDVSAKR